MALVKVWNNNVHPFTQEFKSRSITIPPQEYIEMDYEEAVEFKGKFSPIITDGDGNPLPESYKMLKVERPAQLAAVPSLVNHATGQQAATADELRAMLAEFSHLRVEDKDLDKGPSKFEAIQTENLELRARLDAIESMLAAQGAPKKATKK